MFNAISDHLRKYVRIGGDIIFNLSVAWDRYTPTTPANVPRLPANVMRLPVNVTRNPKPVSNPSRANRKRTSGQPEQRPMTSWLDKVAVALPFLQCVHVHYFGYVLVGCVFWQCQSQRSSPCSHRVALPFGHLTAATANQLGLERLRQNAVQTALFKSGGHPGGQFERDSDLVANIEPWSQLSETTRRKSGERFRKTSPMSDPALPSFGRLTIWVRRSRQVD